MGSWEGIVLCEGGEAKSFHPVILTRVLQVGKIKPDKSTEQEGHGRSRAEAQGEPHTFLYTKPGVKAAGLDTAQLGDHTLIATNKAIRKQNPVPSLGSVAHRGWALSTPMTRQHFQASSPARGPDSPCSCPELQL